MPPYLGTSAISWSLYFDTSVVVDPFPVSIRQIFKKALLEQFVTHLTLLQGEIIEQYPGVLKDWVHIPNDRTETLRVGLETPEKVPGGTELKEEIYGYKAFTNIWRWRRNATTV